MKGGGKVVNIKSIHNIRSSRDLFGIIIIEWVLVAGVLGMLWVCKGKILNFLSYKEEKVKTASCILSIIR